MRQFIYLITLILSISALRGQSLQDLFERETSYQHFSGCIQVIKNGRTHFEYCAGNASPGRPNELSTAFDIGSVSKQFTAAAILTLVHEQKMGLADPINDYLGKYASERWEDVTIHHLLTHTSGIPSLFQSGQGLKMVMPKKEPVSLDELINYFSDVKLLFDPGEEYRYSNSGYILLATIIEHVTAQKYGTYIQKMAMSYGLNQTTFGPSDNYAKPYYGYRADLRPGVDYHKSWTFGAGGIHSTVADLAKWTHVIQSDEFLSAELRQEYIKPHTRRGGGKYYAYGWEVNEEAGTVSHDGMNFGYVAYLGFKPEQHTSIAILTNQSYESLTLTGASAAYIEELQTKVWKILESETIEMAPAISSDECIQGTYQFDDGYQLTITKMDTAYQIIGQGSYAPTRKVFQHAVTGTSKKVEALNAVAYAVKKDRFWGMGAVCDSQMKIAIYTGLFSWGFGQVTADLGEILEVVPYQIGEQTGLIRLTGEHEILDVIIYFNAEDEVQGIFEHGFYQSFDNKEMIAFPIATNQLYLDGFPYGEKSAWIEMDEKKLTLQQEGRVFEAVRLKNP